ncbi:MAG: rod shape-determining protein MreD [Deltaproteobacteria bacterium CG_4_8_14_3_um_filter_45_9]|nr:MAG: rod shape-determining protein MreD [Deltaproteobacteria bacterium CG03_land_8_20_14_0_80_45_14]PIX21299.1 MAG: rod shape-determining protein MreD [Deltaproteobacteria bacterium CG_4_8_14_3_um_filter_45_9]
MKRVIPPLLGGIFFLILQTTVLSSFPIQRVRPDILLIFTLYLAFLFPPIFGGILAFFIGYLMDLYSGNTLGFYAFSRPLVFFAAQFFKERFYLEEFSFQFLFAFIFGMLEGILILILMNALQPVSLGNLYPLLFTFLLPQSFFTGLATPPLFFLFQKGSSLLFHQPEKGIKERV